MNWREIKKYRNAYADILNNRKERAPLCYFRRPSVNEDDFYNHAATFGDDTEEWEFLRGQQKFKENLRRKATYRDE